MYRFAHDPKHSSRVFAERQLFFPAARREFRCDGDRTNHTHAVQH